jgi:hypothetical protein
MPRAFGPAIRSEGAGENRRKPRRLAQAPYSLHETRDTLHVFSV